MELLDFPIKLKRHSDPIFIHVFSDIHRASAGCDSKKLRSDISKFKHAVEVGDEYHYWLGGGDWSNAIGPKDRRFDRTAIAPEFQEYAGDDLFGVEARRLISEFQPIRNWGIGIGMGNHEETIAKSGEYNPSVAIASGLNLPFLGYNAIIRFRISVDGASAHSATVLFYWHHGRGAARTVGAKANMLLQMKEVVDADVYCVGHTHEIIDFPRIVMSATRRGTLRLVTRKQIYFNSGTYLRAYNTEMEAQRAGQFIEGAASGHDYAEKAAYSPSVIGHNGFKMRIHHASGVSRKNTKDKRQWEMRFEKVQF